MLIYLIRRSRLAREAAELERSLRQSPDASMYLLTWEDLDEVLAQRLHVRWANELHRYLGRRRLAAFRGFVVTFARAPSPALDHWKLQPRRTSPTFVAAMPRRPAISLLARRELVFTSAHGCARAIRAQTMPLVHQLAIRTTRFPEH